MAAAALMTKKTQSGAEGRDDKTQIEFRSSQEEEPRRTWYGV